MLKFYRKIRQRLINDHKLGNYLFYAVGEILLVVIGILLALQINNWNTDRLETKELHSYLNNIKKNIIEDQAGIKEMLAYRDTSRLRSKKYINAIDDREITFSEFDEIIETSWWVFRDQVFSSNTSGFETLKSSGFFRKLHSTLLEEKLNQYYYLVEKIIEQEKSLNNTVEQLQIISFGENVIQRLVPISKIEDKATYFQDHKQEITELLNHTSLTGAHDRNFRSANVSSMYDQLSMIGDEIIGEIGRTVQK